MRLSVLRSSVIVGLAVCGFAGGAPAQGPDSLPGDTGEDLPRRAENGPPPATRNIDGARLFAQLDRDGDGKLTLDEIPEAWRERIRPLFERLGTDVLTPADLDRPREAPRPRGERRGAIRGPAIFRVLDENDDGRISREELAKAGEKFDELDQDANGAITPDELFALPGGDVGPSRRGTEPAAGNDLQSTTPTIAPAAAPNGDAAQEPAPDNDLAGRLFRRYDLDRDRRLSSDEAPATLRRHFDRFDADGDGQVDEAEFRDVAARVELMRNRSRAPGGAAPAPAGDGPREAPPPAPASSPSDRPAGVPDPS